MIGIIKDLRYLANPANFVKQTTSPAQENRVETRRLDSTNHVNPAVQIFIYLSLTIKTGY